MTTLIRKLPAMFAVIAALVCAPAYAQVTLTELQKLLATDGKIDHQFGYSVAIDGDTVVIGAPDEGDWNGGRTYNGAAYVFTRSGGIWTEQAKLLASDQGYMDNFGESVAINGNTVVIGAIGEGDWNGAAYVFTRSGEIWTEQAKLLASDKTSGDLFGWSVAIDGDIALIGAAYEGSGTRNNGAAYVFTRSGGTWTEQAKLLASDKADWDRFGCSVAIDGDTAVIGAFGKDHSDMTSVGAAYVFTRSGGFWAEQAKLLASDKFVWGYFGSSVAIDGDTVVVGADGDHDNGLVNNGAAYVFTRSGEVWAEQAKLLASDKATNDSFGIAVAIDGDTAVIGANQRYDQDANGSAYVFARSGGLWTEQAKLLARYGAVTDDFGSSVAIDRGIAIVGAPHYGLESGAAYVYELDGPSPTTIRMEAEEMQLDTYRVEALDFASNGALINLKGPGYVGSASAPFPGPSGTYDISVVYHDENDGLAQLSVTIDGETVDTWTLDFSSSEAQPKETNRLVRQIVTGQTVNNGDAIRIDGLQGNWDHANVDYIEFDAAKPQPPPTDTVRIEAEDMALDTYRVEVLSFASNGALINLKGPGMNGSATSTFPGSSGKYDVVVVYHDENDGVAQLTVSIGGVSIDSWLLDLTSSEAQPKPANRFTRQVATGITVNNGDEIRIDGLQGNWDHANVDYIEFVGDQPQPPPDNVRMEAEDMQLDTYRVEALDFASNGALINLKGPGDTGIATATFPGSSGRYNVSVVYHDENDGVAQLTITVAGAPVDRWWLDFKSSEGQPKPANRLSREIAERYPVSNGAEIRIDAVQGNWDHANVDYIEFVPVP